MTAAEQVPSTDTASMLRSHFELQRKEYLAAPNPDVVAMAQRFADEVLPAFS